MRTSQSLRAELAALQVQHGPAGHDLVLVNGNNNNNDNNKAKYIHNNNNSVYHYHHY